MLVERLMAIKVQEAEKMNEINDLYDDLRRQKKENELRAMASDLSSGVGGELAWPRRRRDGRAGGAIFPRPETRRDSRQRGRHASRGAHAWRRRAGHRGRRQGGRAVGRGHGPCHRARV